MLPPPVNVALHLRRRAAETPHTPALYVPSEPVRDTGDTPHRTLTFGELNADADALAHGFAAAGVKPGDRVAVMVPPGADFFALAFALLRRRAVPVLIDPGMGVKNLGNCLAEADPAAFVGIPKAHLARRLFGWLRGRPLLTVNVGGWRFFCKHRLDGLRRIGRDRGPWNDAEPASDETAAILFTSGSTGPAKGAVYTHGIFAAQVELLKATYGIEPGEVDLCTFPLFALFGPALGMSCVVPDMDASRPATLDPGKAMAQIRQFGVTNLFGSPAVIRRIAPADTIVGGFAAPKPGTRRPTDFTARIIPTPLPTIRRVISAGAPARADDLRRFVRLLSQGVQVFTPYGATEALPVANIGSDETLGETRTATEQGRGVCVGRSVPGVTIHIIRISDDPIADWSDSLLSPPGEVGEIVIRGPIVTRSYFNRPHATSLAKITDSHTGEVLHRMGDVGYTDEHGRLWFCGRKAHRVVTQTDTLFTDMVEPVFNTAELVERTALVGVRRAGVTHPVLCVEPRKVYPMNQATGFRSPFAGAWDPGAIKARLREVGSRQPHTRGVTTFLIYTVPFLRGGGCRFPVDVRHNSKIFREKLALWADKQLGPSWNGGVA